MKNEPVQAWVGVCGGCLSTDRDVTLLPSDARVLLGALILKLTPLNALRECDVFLCWECRAVLRRLSRFTRQVTRAQEYLVSHSSAKINELVTLSPMTLERINCETEVRPSEDTPASSPEPDTRVDEHWNGDECHSDDSYDPIKELKPIVEVKEEIQTELEEEHEEEVYKTETMIEEKELEPEYAPDDEQVKKTKRREKVELGPDCTSDKDYEKKFKKTKRRKKEEECDSEYAPDGDSEEQVKKTIRSEKELVPEYASDEEDEEPLIKIKNRRKEECDPEYEPDEDDEEQVKKPKRRKKAELDSECATDDDIDLEVKDTRKKTKSEKQCAETASDENIKKRRRAPRKVKTEEELDPEYAPDDCDIDIEEDIEETTTAFDRSEIDRSKLKRRSHLIGMYERIELKSEEEMLAKRAEMNNDAFKMAAYKCEHCIVYFDRKFVWLRHLKRHRKLHRKYSCHICQMTFFQSHFLNNHIKEHYNYYRCKSCGYKAYSWKDIYDHCIEESEGKKERINQKAIFHMPVSYAKLHELRERERQNEYYTSAKYKCETCIIGFYVQAKYEYHQNQCHSPELDKFICDICAVRVRHKTAMIQHLDIHNTCLKCNACGLVFTRRTAAYHHFKTVHRKGKSYSCKYCPEVFEKIAQLWAHQRVAHKTFPCQKCDRVFKDVGPLNAHLKRHGEQTCKDCGVRCADWTRLLKHRRKHKRPPPPTREKKFYCVECDKYLLSEVTYKSHNINMHSDGKDRTACTICGREVKIKQLQSHMNTMHLRTDLPYRCDQCGKAYAKKHTLESHTKYVHDKVPKEKKHTCDICSRSFTTKRTLVNHRRTHTGERPYSCEYCSAAFAQRTPLITHCRRIHKKEIKPKFESMLPWYQNV